MSQVPIKLLGEENVIYHYTIVAQYCISIFADTLREENVIYHYTIVAQYCISIFADTLQAYTTVAW